MFLPKKKFEFLFVMHLLLIAQVLHIKVLLSATKKFEFLFVMHLLVLAQALHIKVLSATRRLWATFLFWNYFKKKCYLWALIRIINQLTFWNNKFMKVPLPFLITAVAIFGYTATQIPVVKWIIYIQPHRISHI